MKSFAIAVVVVAALACSCSTSSSTPKPSQTTSSTPRPTQTSINPQTLAATLACFGGSASATSGADSPLLGKSLKAAEALAPSLHLLTRVVAEDGTCVNVIGDLEGNRADLWIVNDQVVKVFVEGTPGRP
jgi:hypothetical protein